MTLIITANSLTALIASKWHGTIGWKGVEQAKIDKLAPLEPLSYFTSVLGEPVLKQKVDKMTKYTYRGRDHWVAAYVDDFEIVRLMAITACNHEGFKPKIKNNPVGYEVTLTETKMKYAGRSSSADTYGQPAAVEDFKPHYFLRGATAPTYLYDEYLYGNPSSYQTVYAGFNEFCGFINLPEDIAETMSSTKVGKLDLNSEQIERLRSNLSINTFAVSAPYEESFFKNGSYTLGVTYVDAGILEPRRTEEELEKADSAKNNTQNLKPFEVFNYNR